MTFRVGTKVGFTVYYEHVKTGAPSDGMFPDHFVGTMMSREAAVVVADALNDYSRNQLGTGLLDDLLDTLPIVEPPDGH